jgi:hypothetical protein
MAAWYQRIIHELAEVKRKTAHMVRPGTIERVEKDKMIVNFGQGADGQPYLSPWLNNHNQRGGARERRFYKKGQNVHVVCPDGDPAKGFIAAFAPNEEHPAPDHADTAGAESETFQLDNLRVRKDKDTYDIWLTPQSSGGGQQAAGNGAGGGQQQKDSSLGEGTKSALKLRVHKDGGFTARIGTDCRVAAHKDGAKMRYKEHWYVVQKSSPHLIISEPPVISQDPIPNDDK